MLISVATTFAEPRNRRESEAGHRNASALPCPSGVVLPASFAGEPALTQHPPLRVVYFAAQAVATLLATPSKMIHRPAMLNLVASTKDPAPDRSETPSPPAPERVTARDLTGRLRGLVATVGILGLSTGGIAVFTSDNQAGTVALLTVGSIASVLATVGRIPLRWVIGGNEIDMSEDAARELVDVITSRLGPDETAEVAGQLSTSGALGLSSVANAMNEYVAFELACVARVHRAVGMRGWSYSPSSGARDRGYDGFVLDQNGRRVAIEYKLVRSTSAMRQMLRRLSDQSRSEPMVLVVSTTPGISNVASLSYRADFAPLGIHIVDATGPDFERRFVAACEDALSGSPSDEDSQPPDS